MRWILRAALLVIGLTGFSIATVFTLRALLISDLLGIACFIMALSIAGVTLGLLRIKFSNEDVAAAARRTLSSVRRLSNAATALVSQAEAEPEAQPPIVAEFLAGLFASPKLRPSVVIALADEFDDMVARFGRRRARVFYWAAVLKSIWPLFRSFMRRHGMSILRRLGLIGLVADFLRRHIS